MTSVPMMKLNNGVEMPQLGFGVFLVPPDEVVEPVRTALGAGYRLIDTATLYGNEAGVGLAIRESGIPRDDVFVTTKVWNSDQGYDATMRAFDASASRLGLDVVDLYLIHWPMPARNLYPDTWRALETLHEAGRVRAIGVSNFTVAHLTRLLQEANVVPAVNQVELHPGFPQDELRAFHDEHGIVTESWTVRRRDGRIVGADDARPDRARPGRVQPRLTSGEPAPVGPGPVRAGSLSSTPGLSRP